jgi:3-deoxy-7-phosphoheptulonate synthase
VDFHPNPVEALCDGPQALLISELEHFVKDMELTRSAYLARVELCRQLLGGVKSAPAA